MKSIMKSFALLCMGLATVACVEENFEPNIGNYDTTPGNDIQFSAMAKVDNGNIQTKTEYGNVGTVNGEQYIEVNWSEGDKITIASPEAAGTNIAHYNIGFIADNAGNYSGSHAATVTKRGGVGLQWSESDTYTFYAMYPMLDTADEDADFDGSSQLVLGANGAPAVLRGNLPVTQNPKSLTVDNGNYVVAPDMRYAYMVAYDEFVRPNGDERPEDQDHISLSFKSLSTVLQFQLKAGQIANQNQGENRIKITSVMLYSSNGKPICGPFAYSYPNIEGQSGTSVFDAERAGGLTEESFSQLTMDFVNNDMDIILTQDKTLDLTFFLLPIVEFKKNVEDLRLRILYEINGKPQFMTAKLGVDIEASRKYYFKNVKMKDLTAVIEGSSWFGGVNEDVLLTQVSIPCAGNVFSNESNEIYHKQQTNDYLRLWDLGVRGFELASDYDVQTMDQDFADQKFVVGGSYVGNTTFDQAFKNLVNKLDNSTDECLVIIAKYAPCEADYNPQQYVSDLLSYFSKESGVRKDRFVRLTPTSTVKNLRNKIAVIIRPGDDDYMRHWHSTTTSSLVLKDNEGESWANNVMLVQNWGNAYDRWDMRYKGFTREATWGEGSSNGWNTPTNAQQSDGKSVMENYLFSWSSSYRSYSVVNAYNDLPEITEDIKYSHTLASGDQIHVQEWARVVPKMDQYNKGNGISTNFSKTLSGRYLWVRWPESITQKKKAIDQTFLASIKHNDGSQAYINVLSGYYITTNHMVSTLPFKFRLPYTRAIIGGTDYFQPSGQGDGGNYAALAAELNTYVYDILSQKAVTSTTGQVLPVGPWGLVMIDFIGTDFTIAEQIPSADEFGADMKKATEASSKLCNLILMNNFKFPLSTGGDTGTSGIASVKDFDSVYLDGQNAISFE